MARKNYVMTTANGSYLIKGESTIYDSILPTLGAKAATGREKNLSAGTSGDMVRSGLAVRLTVSFKVGTKTKNARVLCPTNKVQAALTGLLDKTVKGGKVFSARIPRSRTYR
jgi:hypothetical protein